MNWLQSIKHGYSLKVFRNRGKRVKFPHRFVDYEEAGRIGFIINIALMSGKELVAFTKYITQLEESGKKILVIELNLRRKSEPVFSGSSASIFINPKQINWLDFPSVSVLRQINKFECDILYNLDTSERMTSRFICGLSNASMRVGIHEEEYEGFYELLLQIKKGARLREVLDTFERYTKMLKK
mgnify:CR=1 FL=1